MTTQCRCHKKVWVDVLKNQPWKKHFTLFPKTINGETFWLKYVERKLLKVVHLEPPIEIYRYRKIQS